MALATRPKSTVHHRKRQARHHRQSKQYLKPYWPYLPMLLIVGLGLFINNAWSARMAVLGANSDFSSTALLTNTNADRANNHEAALTIDPALTAAAQTKANDMVKNDYWSHNSPDGRTPWSFITAAGYQYQAAGENLAYGFANAGDAVIGWMNSPEHRANILDSAYQNVGFGVASSPDYQGHGPETVVVAEYAQPVAAAANITFTVPSTNGVAGTQNVLPAKTEFSAQPVSRIQLLTGGQAAWSLAVVSALAGAALALFIVRHGLRFRRLMVESEAFISHHPVLDIAIVFIFTAGFVLTRSSGIIR
jgi:uncharacterized protein YkwD